MGFSTHQPSLLFGYFLIVNLMRTAMWVKRCTLSMAFAGTLTALCGVVQYLTKSFSFGGAWLDMTYFSDISGRADALFDNPNVLASYLVLVFPFSLGLFARAQTKKERFIYGFSIFTILLCSILTWSRGAWLGILIGFLIFSLMHSKKTIRYLFLVILFLPFL